MPTKHLMARLVSSAVAQTLVLIGGPAIAGTAPVHSRPLADQAIRARDLIQAMVEHLGGAARLQAIAGLHYVWGGEAFDGLQGYDPARAESTDAMGTVSFTADFDYANHRDRRRTLQVLPGGIRLDDVTYFQHGQVTTTYPGSGRMTQNEGTEAGVTDGLSRYNPAILARRALENIASATYQGARIEKGERVEIVDFSWTVQTRLRLHLATRDKRIVAVESVVARDPLFGDDTISYVFKGERTVQGIVFPREVILNRRGQRFLDTRIDEVEVNPNFPPALFDPPALRPLNVEKATNALGGGAYEITGISGGVFRVIFFDLGDGVAVFDAPESRSRSEAVAAEIRKTLGDKPIKYLVVSHFHDDHVAGVGYYVDHGVQIVTTRANAALVTRYATVNSQLRPDLATQHRTPSFLFVDGERIDLESTGGSALSIYRLADCPHAKNMLLAYQPSGRLIVQADLFVDLAGYSPTSAAFAAWMARPSAPAVDWIVGTHLGRISRNAFDAAGRP